VVVVVVVVEIGGLQKVETTVTKWVDVSDFVVVEATGVWPEVQLA